MAAARLGLCRSQRLLKPAEFQQVLKKGRRARDAHFSVYAQANGKALARLGITVSRRVALRAVVRNRIKRQIRESFRATQVTLAGRDIVVVASQSAAQAANPALRQSLSQLWIKIVDLCAPSS